MTDFLPRDSLKSDFLPEMSLKSEYSDHTTSKFDVTKPEDVRERVSLPGTSSALSKQNRKPAKPFQCHKLI